MLASAGRPTLRTFGPATVPAGHFFVLGDNRDNTADSRYIVFISADQIVGRWSAVVLSFDPDSHLPQWDCTPKPLP